MTTAVALCASPPTDHRDFAEFAHGKTLAQLPVMSKRFVYVLKNGEVPPRYYTGLTSDAVKRHLEHNAGSCTHTAKHPNGGDSSQHSANRVPAANSLVDFLVAACIPV